MATKNFKQGDTLPIITDQLLNANGSAVNLAGATGVSFLARIEGEDEFRISGSATVIVAASGQVSYAFTSTDLALPGDYEYEWQVRDSSGTFRVPTAGWGTFTLWDNVGDSTISSTHASGSIVVNQASLDVLGATLGKAPPGGKVFAYLGEQPVAYSTVDSSGNWSVTLVDDLTYTLKAQYPGIELQARTVNT